VEYCEDSLGDKTLHLSFMELDTYSQSDSRLVLKVTSGIQPDFYKSVNGKLNKKYHTHTHTMMIS
jgi:hypothetical protein